MMVPKRTLLCASTAMLVLGTAVEAQMKPHKVRRVTQPLIRADLDLSTGVYTIGGKVEEKGPPVFNTGVSLTNLDFSGSVAIDSVQCEWFDSFEKGAKNGFTANGHRFTITHGDVLTYTALVEPETPGDTGDTFFFVDQTGVVRIERHQRAGPASKPLAKQ